MQHENSSVPLPHTRAVVPWNKGRFVGPKPPLKPKQVWAIRIHLQREQRVRDLAMFDLAIDSKVRGCDLVKLKIGQVVVNAAARHRATIVQQKTERPVQFELTEQTRESLTAWLNHRGGTGLPRMWGDGDAGDMTGRSIAGWGIVDGVGLALG
jgi:integrase